MDVEMIRKYVKYQDNQESIRFRRFPIANKIETIRTQPS